MQRVKNLIHCDEAVYKKTLGANVTIAVLDTGVFYHPDFSDRILAFQDFVNGNSLPYDDSGHGTHVCGICAGNGRVSKGKYSGIAPEANLVVGKVLNKNGDGDGESMIRGIQWVMELRKKIPIQILNLSIGIRNLEDQKLEDKLIAAIELAWYSGMVVVTAAGNNGPKPMTISPLGASRKVITVGCHDGGYVSKNGSSCDEYSGRGPSKFEIKKPDIVAPGTDIISCSNKYVRFYNNSNSSYTSKSGTSMATPIVSGACALLLSKNPDLNNESVKRKLISSAEDLKESWSKQGGGMLNVHNLLA
ncbi:MAG TPA: S8 family peptidase [Lachnospiraceae bacterium]|nr:S8 family peptidase [Lachnospiraceae bacterium]